MIVENNQRNNALIVQISDIIARNDIMFMTNYPNVVGVGVGQKHMNGIPTGLPCLTILVSKKVDERYLSNYEVIPRSFEGVMTDVYEVDQINSTSNCPSGNCPPNKRPSGNYPPRNYPSNNCPPNKCNINCNNDCNCMCDCNCNNNCNCMCNNNCNTICNSNCNSMCNSICDSMFDNICNSICNNNCKLMCNSMCNTICNGGGSNGGYTGKYRPADGGVVVSNYTRGGSATLGCGVSDSTNIYILGNNHSFSYGNLLPIGEPIIQPSGEFGGGFNDLIARLSNFVTINFITPTTMPVNRVDAALALVGPKSNQQVIAATLLKPGLHNGPKIAGTYTPNIGGRVVKIGAITGQTLGTVMTLNTSVRVNFPNNRVAYFTGQITTTVMSQAGDSGAIGINGANEAFGLLFSASSTISLYNPINEVLSLLNVNFWNL